MGLRFEAKIVRHRLRAARRKGHIMIKSEYKRYLTSKFNIALFLCMAACALLSVIPSLREHAVWREQLLAPAEDLNVPFATEIVNGFNGISLIFDFFVPGAYYSVFVLVLLGGFGVIIGGVTWKNLHSGFGNLIVVRTTYRKYIANLLIAQTGYIATITAAFFLLFTVIAVTLYPPDLSYEIHSNYLMGNNIYECILIGIIVYLLLLVFIVPAMLITSLITIAVKNRFLIQAVPILMYIVPFLIGSTIGNISRTFADITIVFIPDHFLGIPYSFLHTEPAPDIITIVTLPATLIIIAAILYTRNLKIYKSAYL
jgi:hypothetical protein